MELILLACALVGVVIAVFGLTAVVTFAVTLFVYGPVYHDRRDKEYTRAYVNHAMRRWRVWGWLTHWLNHSIAIEPAEHVNEPVIYACRPHGILVVSAWLTFLSGALDRPRRPVVVAVHRSLVGIPFLRDYLFLPLGVIDASEASILHALANGCSVAIMPGGVKEMGPPLLALPDQPGIIRLAHAYNITVVPVHFGGEAQLFWIWHGEWRVVRAIRRFIYAVTRLPFLVVFCPRVWDWPRALVTHVGRPLRPADYANVKDMCDAERQFVAAARV
jgi:hypothetical protein